MIYSIHFTFDLIGLCMDVYRYLFVCDDSLVKKGFISVQVDGCLKLICFGVFFAEYYITCTSAMKCLVAWNNITCMLNYHDNVGMEYYQHILYIYICFVWCAAICYCFNHYSVHCRNEIFNLAFQSLRHLNHFAFTTLWQFSGALFLSLACRLVIKIFH